MLTRNYIDTMYLAADYGVRDRFISGNFPKCNIIFSDVWHEKTLQSKRNFTVCHFHLVQDRQTMKKNKNEINTNWNEKQNNNNKNTQKNFKANESQGIFHAQVFAARRWSHNERDIFRLCKRKWSAIDYNRLAITFGIPFEYALTLNVGAAV